MKVSKSLAYIIGTAIILLLLVLACFAGALGGLVLRGPSEAVVQEPLSTQAYTATDVPATATATFTPIPPTSTPTPTVTPIPTIEGLNCYDQATIEYLIRNNESMQKFAKIEKEGLSHFKRPGKLDDEEFNDVNVKMQNIVADIESLSPPKLLLEFQSYQLGYMRGLEEAFRLGQKGDASGAWAALASAQWYGDLMNHMSQAYYTCGYKLIP